MNITPETKIADLLTAYPELEATLSSFSPAFSALKNPVLRRTVAKVTSLQQAAKVGNVPVMAMVDALREAAGQAPLSDIYAEFEQAEQAHATIERKVTRQFDARPIIEAGGHPKEVITAEAEALQIDDCLEILTPFPPVPIADLLRKKGFNVTIQEAQNGIVSTLIWR